RVIEFGRVYVDERTFIFVENAANPVHALSYRPSAVKLCAPQHRRGEPRRSKALKADRKTRDSRFRRSLEHRRRTLPRQRVETVIPPREQLHDAIIVGIECGVTDHSVFTRMSACG